MMRTFLTAATSAAVIILSPPVFAQKAAHGTAAEARAMLMKAVAAVKKDKTQALEMFNSGQGGFLDRDLYVFCFNTRDGKIVATGNQNAKFVGQDIRSLKDPAGKTFGQDLYAAGQKAEGQITEVDYVFVRPGPDKTPAPKVSSVTRVGDIACGVGYYK